MRGCASSLIRGADNRADDLQYRSVGRTEMLPGFAVRVLNLAEESDPGRDHRAARSVEIIDPEADHRTGSEECVEFVLGTVEFQHSAVAEFEPDKIFRLPGDRNFEHVAEQSDGLIETASADADEADLTDCHCSSLPSGGPQACLKR